MNFPAIATIVNFAILLGALVFFIRKPLHNFLSDRSQTIQDNVEESEKLKQEALTMLRTYQEKLNRLDQEIKIILDQAKKDGEEEKRKIFERAERTASQMIENAKNMAEREIVRQKERLEQELLNKIVAEAIVTLKQKVSEKDHERFTNTLIQQMEKDDGHLN